jgi:hypothetical protein
MPRLNPLNIGSGVCIGVSLLILLSGCAPKDPTGTAQKYIGGVKADALSIRDDAKALTTHVDDAGKPLLASIDTKASRIVEASDNASLAVQDAAKESVKDKQKRAKVEGSTFYQIGEILMWVLKIGVPVLLVGWALLEFGGRFMSTGPTGIIAGWFKRGS